MKKLYTIFILLILTATGFVYLFRVGWHPTALINSQLVWDRSFQKEHESALKYYNQAINTYNLPDMDEEKLTEIQKDLKRATLDKIIEKIIISKGLEDLVGQDKNSLITEKIDKYLENPKLRSAAGALFNLSFQDFRKLVLVPQAEREIIEEKLKEESRDFSNWLENQKHQASVYLFTNEFQWTGGEIKRR